MPHQCTKCGKVYPDASEELLKGCNCSSMFFYYIRQEKFNELRNEMRQIMEELDRADKVQIEKDIRELTGLDEKPDQPVILDLESIRVIKPGKFEIDIVNLFSRERPIIYKLGEGKYIIDIASSLGVKTGADRVVSPLGETSEYDEEEGDEEDEEDEDEEEIEIEEIFKDEKEIDEKNKKLIETSKEIDVINDNNEVKELE